jgi:hypothetical protein
VLGVDNPESFPVVSDSKSQKILWSIIPELPQTSPKIDWWKSELNSECLYGIVETEDTHQYIRFSFIEGQNDARIFIEALSKPSELK